MCVYSYSVSVGRGWGVVGHMYVKRCVGCLATVHTIPKSLKSFSKTEPHKIGPFSGNTRLHPFLIFLSVYGPSQSYAGLPFLC